MYIKSCPYINEECGMYAQCVRCSSKERYLHAVDHKIDEINEIIQVAADDEDINSDEYMFICDYAKSRKVVIK